MGKTIVPLPTFGERPKHVAMTERHLGQVIFFLPDKGFGYLRLYGTLEEFHFSARSRVQRELNPARGGVQCEELKAGDMVRFSLAQGRRGWRVTEVERAGVV